MKKLAYIAFVSSLLFGANADAEYRITITNTDNLLQTVIMAGPGANYGMKPLSEVMESDAAKGDASLNGFVDLIARFQDGKYTKTKGIDAFGLITPSTSVSSIRMNLCINNGDSAMFLFNSQSGQESFSPITLKDGSYTIGGNIMSNSSIIGLVTMYVGVGMQLDEKAFKNYLKAVESLDPKISFPVIVRLSDNESGGNSCAFFTCTISGDLFDRMSELFGSMLESYQKGSDEFYSYWMRQDADALRQFKEANTDEIRESNFSSTDFTRLNSCKNGHSVMGVTDLGDVVVIYVVNAAGEIESFFAQKHEGKWLFARTTMFGASYYYLSAFFDSDPVKNGILGVAANMQSLNEYVKKMADGAAN